MKTAISLFHTSSFFIQKLFSSIFRDAKELDVSSSDNEDIFDPDAPPTSLNKENKEDESSPQESSQTEEPSQNREDSVDTSKTKKEKKQQQKDVFTKARAAKVQDAKEV